jgi:sarcosine oxidase delta subunit
MWNFRKKEKSPDKKDFVIYKDYKPARIVAIERRGRKYFLLITWDNLSHRGQSYEKWVRADQCKAYIPPGKKTLYQQIYGAVKLNWFQNLIVKLQNWYYGRED